MVDRARMTQAELDRWIADHVDITDNGPQPSGDIESRRGFLIPADTVRMTNTCFIERPYIPLGTFTLTVGIGGLGKSHVVIDAASRLSRGDLDGDVQGPAGVIIATAEDALENTMVPRLRAARADLSRVSFVNVEKGFAIPQDIPKLEEALRARGDVRMVVLDPILAFVPMQYDSHKDQHARAAIAPLVALAERSKLAIDAVMHLNKAAEAKELFLRISASSGFFNAARSALLVAEDPDDEDYRVIAHGKHNLSKKGEARRFRIQDVDVEREDGEVIHTSRIVWEGSSEHTVEQLLNSDHRRDPRKKAERWLLRLVSGGPVPRKEIEAAADAEGHAWRTVERAKEDLGIEALRRGFGAEGAWFWALPDFKEPQDSGGEESGGLWTDEGDVSAGQIKGRQDLPYEGRPLARYAPPPRPVRTPEIVEERRTRDPDARRT
jgi:putative DNA primase/helicase